MELEPELELELELDPELDDSDEAPHPTCPTTRALSAGALLLEDLASRTASACCKAGFETALFEAACLGLGFALFFGAGLARPWQQHHGVT